MILRHITAGVQLSRRRTQLPCQYVYRKCIFKHYDNTGTRLFYAFVCVFRCSCACVTWLSWSAQRSSTVFEQGCCRALLTYVLSHTSAHTPEPQPLSAFILQQHLVTVSVMMQPPEVKEAQPAQQSSWARNLKIGAAAVAGGTLLAVTGIVALTPSAHLLTCCAALCYAMLRYTVLLHILGHLHSHASVRMLKLPIPNDESSI